MTKIFDSKTILVILNAISRSALDARDAVESALRELEIDHILKITDSPEQLPNLISQYADQVNTVAVGGGDGTVNTALKPIIDHGLTLALLPLGTANDLAQSLGIPQDISEACKILQSGRVHPIDVGTVNGHYFVNVADIGFSVIMTRNLNREKKKRLGVLGYALGLLDAFRCNRPFRLHLETDRETATMNSIQLIIGNGPRYGGGMIVTSKTKLNDGLLHILVLKPQRLVDLLMKARSFRYGDTEGFDDIEVFACTKARIRTSKQRSVTADGEILTKTPVEFVVHHQALNVLAPRETNDEKGSLL